MKNKLLVLAIVSISPSVAFSETVDLGASKLHGGIAKGDKLTIDEVKAYLSDTRNHEPLDVALPVGLDAAKQSVYIPEDNPLTLARSNWADSFTSIDDFLQMALFPVPIAIRPVLDTRRTLNLE